MIKRGFIAIALFALLISVVVYPIPSWLMHVGIQVIGAYEFNCVVDTALASSRFGSIMALGIYSAGGNLIFSQEYSIHRNEWFLIIITVSISDALQYIIGKRFGRHRISPISPGKTLEGYLGSLLTIPLLILFVSIQPLLVWISLGILGDGFVSYLKRRLLLKDISNLLGPHGGWLDRFDGIYMVFWVTRLYQILCY